MAKIISESLLAALVAESIVPSDTRRVIIEIESGKPPVVHVEKYGTAALVQVVRASVQLIDESKSEERDING